MAHSGRHDLSTAKEGMLLLIANDGPLPAEWLDHPLVGEWKGYREFHAKGDLLVIYKDEPNAVTFVRIGTHSELF